MFYNDDFYTSLEASKKLSEIGFDEWCEVFWSTGSTVRDDIIEKYPGLSDDGYYELTNIAGGDLAWEDVYTNDYHLDNWNNKNSELMEDFGDSDNYSAPIIQQAMSYIRKNFHYEIVYTFYEVKYDIRVIHTDTNAFHNTCHSFDTWEEAMNYGIIMICNDIIAKKDA